MRATQLRLIEHGTEPGEAVCEVLHKGKFVGHITGSNAAGIRLVSCHKLEAKFMTDGVINIVEIRIEP